MIAFWISLANPSCPSAPNLAPIREKYGVVENIIPGEVRQAKMHKVSDIRLKPPSATVARSFFRLLLLRQRAVPIPITEIDRQADGQPDAEAQPDRGRQGQHQSDDADERRER